MALRIEKAFGVSMDTLMRMQNSYDIARVRDRAGEIKVGRFPGKRGDPGAALGPPTGRRHRLPIQGGPGIRFRYTRADHDPPLSMAKMTGYAFGFNPPCELSAQTPDVSRYVDAIVAMTPIVMAASAKLNTANDQAL